MPAIRLEKVAKLYKGKGRHTAAVLNIDLEIIQGEFVFVVGSRGAGKSTLLDIMSGEMQPDQGTVLLNDTDLYRLNRRQKGKLHRVIGRVPQDPALLRGETIYDNMTGPRKAIKFPSPHEEKLVRKALALVGMPGTERRCPREFSYSQCRRLELAKAIVNSPPILILDAITDQIDDDSIWDIFLLLNELNARGTTIIMSTNSRKFVNIMRRRVITLSDGRLVGDVRRGRYGDIVK